MAVWEVLVRNATMLKGRKEKVLEGSDSVDGLDLEAGLAFPVLVRGVGSLHGR